MRRALAALLLLVIALMPTRGAAQQAGRHIAHTLVAESERPAPGGTTTLALAMTPAPGWHGYWVNGGDAGFGMEVVWTLPPGVSIGPLAYPVPSRLVIGGLMNHVYEAPYALLAPLTLSSGLRAGTELPIRGEARWLACTDRVCVPESGTFSATLTVGDGGFAAPSRARFDGWRGALPQPLGSPVSYARDGDRLRLSIPLPAALTLDDPHLFVETPRVDRPGAEQSFFRVGDRLIVETAAGGGLGGMRDFSALLAIAPGRGLSFTAQAGYVPPPPDAPPPAAGGFDAALFWTALGGAIVGGLILNIMPCVFPILSLKALTLARAGGDARHARAEGLAYAGGAIFTALSLGAVLLLLRAGGEAVGWAFQLQSPPSILLLIVLTAAIVANLAGLFDVPALSFNLGRAARGGTAAAPDPIKSAFATGALAAFIATPCSGPFLGAALGATLALPAWAALPVFGGLGLGLALPFLAIALVPALRGRLPKPGPWMNRLRRWLAVPMALTVAALVWLLGRQVGAGGWLIGALAAAATLALGWWAGRAQNGARYPGPAFLAMAALIVPLSLLLPQPRATLAPPSGALAAERWSAERVTAARARGPVFVYFTADWCVSCKVNEAAAIERAETAAAFRAAGVTTLVADWTNADPAIARELARHGRNSVPLYLWYPAGAVTPEILPQLLTPTMLVTRARASS